MSDVTMADCYVIGGNLQPPRPLTEADMDSLKRWPNRLHAVTLDGVVAGASRGTFESACGVRRLRLYGVVIGDRTVAALWPPRVKGMPDGRTRCQECWELTGRKRPRTEWRIGEVS